MIDSNRENKIDFSNVEFIKFGIQTRISVVDSIWVNYYKWAIDNSTKYNNISFITLLISNINAKFATHIEESLLIYYCQVFN